jgi:serine/threonine-protein kinase
VASALGPYVLLEKIAVGGMAEIFKAKLRGSEGFEQLIAIKRILPELVLDEKFTRMFIDEAKIAVQLSHPNIATILDLGYADDSYYIALELIHGKDMRSIQKRQVSRGANFPIPFVLHVALRVCEALDHAHNAVGRGGIPLRVIHRDVSPQNVLVSYEGVVKVIDFGLAKATGRSTQTQAGTLKGKLAYMSPEQAFSRPIDHRSDIFSLGICMFEWLTREILFQRGGDLDTIGAVQMCEVPSLRAIDPRIPPRLDALVQRMLRRHPDDRFQSALDLHEQLETFVLDEGLSWATSEVGRYMTEIFPEESAVSGPGSVVIEAPAAMPEWDTSITELSTDDLSVVEDDAKTVMTPDPSRRR